MSAFNIWVLVCLLLFVIVILLIQLKIHLLRETYNKTNIRNDFLNADDSNVFSYGNAQLLGEREVQSNYFSVLTSGASFFAVVADGVIDKPHGSYAAVLTVETLKHEYLLGSFKQTTPENFFINTLTKINKKIDDHLYENYQNLKLTAVIIEGGFLYAATTMGTSLYLYRKRELINIADNKHIIAKYNIQISRLNTAQNDIILLLSSGAAESLTEKEIQWHLSRQNHPYSKCQKLAEQIRQKRLKTQGNATIIIAEQMTETVQAWDRDYANKTATL